MSSDLSRNNASSDILSNADLRVAIIDCIREQNGETMQAIVESLVTKAEAREFEMDNWVARIYPTAQNVADGQGRPELWYRYTVRKLFSIKLMSSRKGFQNGDLDGYMPFIGIAIQLGIDANDFTPPLSLNCGLRRFYDIVGRDNVVEKAVQHKNTFMATLTPVDYVFEPTTEMIRHVRDIGENVKNESLAIGFVHGFCAAFGAGILDGFEYGVRLRLELDQNDENTPPRMWLFCFDAWEFFERAF